MENQVDVFLETPMLIMQMEDQNTLVRLTYTEKSDFDTVTDEIYKENLTVYANKVEELKPTKLIVDTKAGSFSVSPELQEWTAKEISPKTVSLKRIAFVVSDDVFAAVSTQQLMEEEGIVEHYQTQHFNSLSEAEKWVNE